MPRESREGRTRPVNICFVTGTRAEFGLMESTLRAIRAHPSLHLQILVTGMHLDRRHGRSINQIRDEGWKIDAVVPWPASSTPESLARTTGRALASMAGAFESLGSQIILVVGDRVEAFAAAAAAHIGGRLVAHVHGGDRALGQVDDALRHAISKLAHIHFPATQRSAERLRKMGEDAWRIHRVGSPGIDDIRSAAIPSHQRQEWCPAPRGQYALLVLHPAGADEAMEYKRADVIYQAIRRAGPQHLVIIHPNNDPGAGGIIRRWDELADNMGHAKPGVHKPILWIYRNAPRPVFLALMRDAAMLIGNSSSGIIEAASFGTPVIDIGPRQKGREHGNNVVHVDDRRMGIQQAVGQVWNQGRIKRFRGRNPYGSGRTGVRIASLLATRAMDPRLQHKLIAY